MPLNPIDEPTQPSPLIRCNGKSEVDTVIRKESHQKGSVMPSPVLFGISVMFGLAAWGAVAWHYIWPALRERPSPENLRPILLLHAFRFLGLAFVVPGVVSSALPATFAQPVAYGDLISAVLALLAVGTLGTRTGTVVNWAFNTFGTADLLFAFYLGSRISLPDNQGLLGAGYFIFAAYVPLLLITHGLVFRMLLRTKVVVRSRNKLSAA
jgi:hypothetical protein